MNHDESPGDPGGSSDQSSAETIGERPTRAVEDSASVAAPDHLEEGAILDERYEIVDLLGTGGMGSVFKAEDLELYELVALKVLHGDAARDEEAIEQFRREVRLARRVTHRNVARTYDIGTSGGLPFLTMEYIEGDSLREMIEAGDLSLAEVVSIADDICAGLQEAHRAGVIHRDLKPENVLVSEGGRIAISYFGLSGALRSGGGRETIRDQRVGTPAYMAPEQVLGSAEMDHRVDVYAMGLVIYEMLSGELPWTATDPIAMAVARVEEPHRPIFEVVSEVPDRLGRLVERCLEREVGGRPVDISEVRNELQDLSRSTLDSQPIRPRRSNPAQPATGDSPAFRRTAPIASPSGHTSAGRQSGEPEAVRVAVLPLGHPARTTDGVVAAGIRDDVIYRLRRIDGIDVYLTDAGAALEFGCRDAIEIGRELGMDAVAHGSLELEGDQVHLDLHLEATDTGRHICNIEETVARDRANRLGRGLAREIAVALGVDLDDGHETVTELDSATSTLLMRGQHLLRERWFNDVEPAIEPLEQAYERAPNHPRTVSQLAIARARQIYLDPNNREEHLNAAVTLARRAIDLADDNWAEPRYALAMAQFNGHRYARAIATLRAAIEREPDFAEAHELLGRIFLEIGPLERGIEQLETAVELNPFLPRPKLDLMRGYALRGDWDGVVEIAREPFDSQHNKIFQALSAGRLSIWNPDLGLGKLAEEKRELVEQSELANSTSVLEVGEFDESVQRGLEAYAQDRAERSRRRSVYYQIGAELAVDSDRIDAAYDLMDKSIDAGLTDIVWLRHCPLFDDLRSEPEFIRRMERVRGRVEAVREFD